MHNATERTMWTAPPGVVRPAVLSTLLAESDGPCGVKILTLKPHYRQTEASVGRRCRWLLQNADLEWFCQRRNWGVWSWPLSSGLVGRGAFLRKSEVVLGQTGAQANCPLPGGVWSHWRAGLRLRSSLKCSLIWLFSTTHKRLLIAFLEHWLSTEIT